MIEKALRLVAGYIFSTVGEILAIFSCCISTVSDTWAVTALQVATTTFGPESLKYMLNIAVPVVVVRVVIPEIVLPPLSESEISRDPVKS